MTSTNSTEMFRPHAFEFDCLSCNESFTIHISKLKDKTSITCPNCGQIMDDKFLTHLKNASTEILEAIEELNPSFEKEELKGLDFSFRIRWNNYFPVY